MERRERAEQDDRESQKQDLSSAGEPDPRDTRQISEDEAGFLRSCGETLVFCSACVVEFQLVFPGAQRSALSGELWIL